MPLRPDRFATAGVVLLLLALTGCDPTGVRLEPGNVEMLVNARVAQSDTAVVVDGRTAIRFPSNWAALWLDRFDHYEFGGFPELDYPQDEQRTLSWRLALHHRSDVIERNDSTIHVSVDHGTVSVEGTEMDRLDQDPHVGSGAPIGFDNYVSYLLSTRFIMFRSGGDPDTWHETDFHDPMIAGATLTLETTGSDDVGPLTAEFAMQPFAPMIAVENGGAVDLDAFDMPVIGTDRALALTFERPLDPGRAAIILHVFPGGGAGSDAWIQATRVADRWVIPADALAQLIAGSSDDRVAYRMIVLEYVTQDDVVTGELADGTPFSLPFVQRAETTFPFYLERR